MLVPGSANPLLLRTVAAPAAGGISRSLRFNSSDSAYLSRTPASAGNRTTWTWAGWVKRATLGTNQTIFSAVQDSNNGTVLRFNSTDSLEFFNFVSAGYAGRRITSSVYRDASAWYHIVLVWDSTNATTSSRIRLYVNGSEVTTFSTTGDPASSNSIINSTSAHYLGTDLAFNNQYLSAYLADLYFVNAQALTPSSFTETDATTGQLIPKAFSGSYGSQGWHLEFADNSSNTATTLGKDTSGNGNNWTPNNLSVTAGAGNDSLVDVPTNGTASTGGDPGGSTRGNYCTWNPLKKVSSATAVNGNLAFTVPNDGGIASTFAASSGKWYWEIVLSSGRAILGLATINWDPAVYPGNTAQGWGYSAFNGNKIHNGSSTSYGSSFTTGDVIGVAFDADAGTLTFYKNGTSQGQAFTGITGSAYQPALGGDGGTTGAGDANFGQRPFAYTAPSGFKALCTANLPAPAVVKSNTVFDTVLWTGNDTGQTIAMPGAFSPDFVWTKMRSAANAHWLFDVVRGANQGISSSSTNAESTRSSTVTAFGSTGFTLGTSADVNSSAYTYVAWAWDAGSSTVTNNTAGTITPTGVRANATAGFSIVTYTGNGNSASTVGHGLGVAPPLVIAKSRSTSDSWVVYTNIIDGSNDYLLLNSTAAKVNSSHSSPTSTVFNPSLTMGPSVTCVAYCFAPVVGYSSFGSYTGNGSTDGPFVYTGFRPRWIMVKRTDSTASWQVFDAARNTYNALTSVLFPDTTDAEASNSVYAFDFISNGFKVRSSQTQFNASGGTYIYAAFAESPFNYARAR